MQCVYIIALICTDVLLLLCCYCECEQYQVQRSISQRKTWPENEEATTVAIGNDEDLSTQTPPITGDPGGSTHRDKTRTAERISPTISSRNQIADHNMNQKLRLTKQDGDMTTQLPVVWESDFFNTETTETVGSTLGSPSLHSHRLSQSMNLHQSPVFQHLETTTSLPLWDEDLYNADGTDVVKWTSGSRPPDNERFVQGVSFSDSPRFQHWETTTSLPVWNADSYNTNSAERRLDLDPSSDKVDPEKVMIPKQRSRSQQRDTTTSRPVRYMGIADQSLQNQYNPRQRKGEELNTNLDSLLVQEGGTSSTPAADVQSMTSWPMANQRKGMIQNEEFDEATGTEGNNDERHMLTDREMPVEGGSSPTGESKQWSIDALHEIEQDRGSAIVNVTEGRNQSFESSANHNNAESTSETVTSLLDDIEVNYNYNKHDILEPDSVAFHVSQKDGTGRELKTKLPTDQLPVIFGKRGDVIGEAPGLDPFKLYQRLVRTQIPFDDRVYITPASGFQKQPQNTQRTQVVEQQLTPVESAPDFGYISSFESSVLQDEGRQVGGAGVRVTPIPTPTISSQGLIPGTRQPTVSEQNPDNQEFRSGIFENSQRDRWQGADSSTGQTRQPQSGGPQINSRLIPSGTVLPTGSVPTTGPMPLQGNNGSPILGNLPLSNSLNDASVIPFQLRPTSHQNLFSFVPNGNSSGTGQAQTNVPRHWDNFDVIGSQWTSSNGRTDFRTIPSNLQQNPRGVLNANNLRVQPSWNSLLNQQNSSPLTQTQFTNDWSQPDGRRDATPGRTLRLQSHETNNQQIIKQLTPNIINQSTYTELFPFSNENTANGQGFGNVLQNRGNQPPTILTWGPNANTNRGGFLLTQNNRLLTSNTLQGSDGDILTNSNLQRSGGVLPTNNSPQISNGVIPTLNHNQQQIQNNELLAPSRFSGLNANIGHLPQLSPFSVRTSSGPQTFNDQRQQISQSRLPNSYPSWTGSNVNRQLSPPPFQSAVSWSRTPASGYYNTPTFFSQSTRSNTGPAQGRTQYAQNLPPLTYYGGSRPTAQNFPTNLNRVPSVTQNFPTNFNQVPSVTQNIPANFNRVPSVIQNAQTNLNRVPPVTNFNLLTNWPYSNRKYGHTASPPPLAKYYKRNLPVPVPSTNNQMSSRNQYPPQTYGSTTYTGARGAGLQNIHPNTPQMYSNAQRNFIPSNNPNNGMMNLPNSAASKTPPNSAMVSDKLASSLIQHLTLDFFKRTNPAIGLTRAASNNRSPARRITSESEEFNLGNVNTDWDGDERMEASEKSQGIRQSRGLLPLNTRPRATPYRVSYLFNPLGVSATQRMWTQQERNHAVPLTETKPADSILPLPVDGQKKKAHSKSSSNKGDRNNNADNDDDGNNNRENNDYIDALPNSAGSDITQNVPSTVSSRTEYVREHSNQVQIINNEESVEVEALNIHDSLSGIGSENQTAKDTDTEKTLTHHSQVMENRSKELKFIADDNLLSGETPIENSDYNMSAMSSDDADAIVWPDATIGAETGRKVIILENIEISAPTTSNHNNGDDIPNKFQQATSSRDGHTDLNSSATSFLEDHITDFRTAHLDDKTDLNQLTNTPEHVIDELSTFEKTITEISEHKETNPRLEIYRNERHHNDPQGQSSSFGHNRHILPRIHSHHGLDTPVVDQQRTNLRNMITQMYLAQAIQNLQRRNPPGLLDISPLSRAKRNAPAASSNTPQPSFSSYRGTYTPVSSQAVLKVKPWNYQTPAQGSTYSSSNSDRTVSTSSIYDTSKSRSSLTLTSQNQLIEAQNQAPSYNPVPSYHTPTSSYTPPPSYRPTPSPTPSYAPTQGQILSFPSWAGQISQSQNNVPVNPYGQSYLTPKGYYDPKTGGYFVDPIPSTTFNSTSTLINRSNTYPSYGTSSITDSTNQGFPNPYEKDTSLTTSRISQPTTGQLTGISHSNTKTFGRYALSNPTPSLTTSQLGNNPVPSGTNNRNYPFTNSQQGTNSPIVSSFPSYNNPIATRSPTSNFGTKSPIATSIPSYINPSIPSYNKPTIPSYNNPSIPSYNSPSIPSNNNPSIPTYNKPSIPSYNNPIIPSYNSPSIPSYNNPIPTSIPKYNNLSFPSYNNPTPASIPSYNNPSIPKYNNPSIPSYNNPIPTSIPSYNNPSIPSYSNPSTPSYNNPIPTTIPTIPNYNNPSIPNYNNPIPPSTPKYNNPSPNYPILIESKNSNVPQGVTNQELKFPSQIRDQSRNYQVPTGNKNNFPQRISNQELKFSSQVRQQNNNYLVPNGNKNYQQVPKGNQNYQVPNGNKNYQQVHNGNQNYQVPNGNKNYQQVPNGNQNYQVPNGNKNYQVSNGNNNNFPQDMTNQQFNTLPQASNIGPLSPDASLGYGFPISYALVGYTTIPYATVVPGYTFPYDWSYQNLQYPYSTSSQDTLSYKQQQGTTQPTSNYPQKSGQHYKTSTRFQQNNKSFKSTGTKSRSSTSMRSHWNSQVKTSGKKIQWNPPMSTQNPYQKPKTPTRPKIQLKPRFPKRPQNPKVIWENPPINSNPMHMNTKNYQSPTIMRINTNQHYTPVKNYNNNYPKNQKQVNYKTSYPSYQKKVKYTGQGTMDKDEEAVMQFILSNKQFTSMNDGMSGNMNNMDMYGNMNNMGMYGNMNNMGMSNTQMGGMYQKGYGGGKKYQIKKRYPNNNKNNINDMDVEAIEHYLYTQKKFDDDDDKDASGLLGGLLSF